MIKVEHLTKYYGDFLAVDDLSFEIDEGHVYGFLGPNGAGKSTTMNIIRKSRSSCTATTVSSVWPWWRASLSPWSPAPPWWTLSSRSTPSSSNLPASAKNQDRFCGPGFLYYSFTRKRMAWLSRLETVSSPLCFSTMALAMDSPMPKPLP